MKQQKISIFCDFQQNYHRDVPPDSLKNLLKLFRNLAMISILSAHLLDVDKTQNQLGKDC